MMGEVVPSFRSAHNNQNRLGILNHSCLYHTLVHLGTESFYRSPHNPRYIFLVRYSHSRILSVRNNHNLWGNWGRSCLCLTLILYCTANHNRSHQNLRHIFWLICRNSMRDSRVIHWGAGCKH